MWGWVVNATRWPLQARERGTVPIPQEAGWDPGLVWIGTENIVSTGIWSLDHPAHSKSLYQICYLSPHPRSNHLWILHAPASEWHTCSLKAIWAYTTKTTSNEQKANLNNTMSEKCEITNGSSICFALTGLVLNAPGSHTYDQFKSWPGHGLLWHSEESYCFNFDHEDEGSKIFWSQTLTAQRQNVTYQETQIFYTILHPTQTMPWEPEHSWSTCLLPCFIRAKYK